jgi:hypothetical protein
MHLSWNVDKCIGRRLQLPVSRAGSLCCSLLVVLAIAGACNNKDAAQNSSKGTLAGANTGSTAQINSAVAQLDQTGLLTLGASLSQLNGTPLIQDAPAWVDISRNGSVLAMWGLNRTDQTYYLMRFPVAEGNLGQGELLADQPDLLRPYCAVHPFGREVVGAKYFQANAKAQIVDVVLRFGPELPTEAVKEGALVPYNSVPGFPQAGAPNMAMDLEPFYDWSGDRVIVPLKDAGLSVVGLDGIQRFFAPYPELEGGFSGMALGPLPGDSDGDYIYLSKWRVTPAADACAIWVLNLRTQQWEEIVRLDWIAYRIGTSSTWGEPWLVAGSRAPNARQADGTFYAPQEGATGVRVAKLARIVPRAGLVQTVELQGNPVWYVGMAASGKYVAYVDRRRHAMVRVEPASGKVDIDPRWWLDDEEVKVLISGDGEKVFFWKGATLIRGQWSEHEDNEGYDELKPASPDGLLERPKPGPADMPEPDEADPAQGRAETGD